MQMSKSPIISGYESRAFERGFIRCIGTGHGEPRKGPWISEVPHGLSNWRFIFTCSLFFWYFQLKSTILREVSACPQSPMQYCSSLQYFFWRPCCRYIIIILFSQPIIKWKKNNTLCDTVGKVKKIQTLARNEFAKWRRYKHLNRELKFLK
jgi:hypothetical protein